MSLSNTAFILDLSPSFRFKFVLFFPPSANFSPSIIIDFPAPVSPVKALKPVIKFIEIFLINKKFLISKDMSIEINLFFEFQNFLLFDHLLITLLD